MKLIPIFLFLTQTSLLWAQFDVREHLRKQQESREKTRWTLTQWLETKERMKAMDMWLQMMSEPKSPFQFSTSFWYHYHWGKISPSNIQNPSYQKHEAQIELWPINVFNSLLGVRTLNLDWGILLNYEQTLFEEKLPSSNQWDDMEISMGLRFLGDHTQDTSLTAFLGFYQNENHENKEISQGLLLGGHFQLYLLGSLGFDVLYKNKGLFTDTKQQGQKKEIYEASGFVEVGPLRLRGGYHWSHHNDVQKLIFEGTFIGGELLL